MQKKNINLLGLVGLCAILTALPRIAWGQTTVNVTGNVTISNTSSNANYLDKNITIASGAKLTYSSYAPNQTVPITITNNGTLEFALWSNQVLVTGASKTLTLNGNGTFIKSGTSLLQTLSGDYDIVFAFGSGAQFNITAGTFRNGEWLKQNWRNNKSDMTISAGATLDLWDGGYADTSGDYTTKTGVIIDGLNGAGTVTATAASDPGTFVMGVDNGNGSFSGSILGGTTAKTISILKKGTGTQIFTGTNTYTGTTTISEGTLQIGDNTNTGTLGSGAVSVAAGATLAFQRKNEVEVTNAITGTGTIAVRSGAVSFASDFNGTVNVAANSVVAVASKANLQTGTYNIAENGVLAVNVDETSTGWTKDEFLALRANATPFASFSNVTWGTNAVVGLNVETGNSVNTSGMFGVATPLYKTGGGEMLLDSNAYDAAVATPVTVMGGTFRLTGSDKFNGTTNVVNGAEVVFDVGTGLTRVLDQAVSGEGNLVVKSGTLQVTSASPTISYTHTSGTNTATVNAKIDTSTVTINNGAKLYFANQVMPHNDRAVTFQIDAGGTLEFNNTSDTVNHNVTNTITQEVSSGTVRAGGDTTITGGGTLLKTGAGAIALLANSNGTRKITIAMDAGGLIDIQEGTFINGGWSHQNWANNKASMNLASGTTLNLWDGASVTIDALTGSGTITRGKTRTFTVGAGNHTAGTYNEAGTATFTGKFGSGEVSSGVGLSLAKVGTGTQIMAGTNNYDGTTVSAGTLQFNANSNIGTGNVSVASGATLNLNNGLNNTVGGAFFGAGTVQLNSKSKLTSANFSSFTGTLATTDDTSVTLSVADGQLQTFSGTVSGTGSFTKTGTGTMRISGTLANTGGVTYDGGKIIFSSAGSMGSNFRVTADTTAEFLQGQPYSITLYANSAGNGRVRPTDSIVGTSQGTSYNMDGCVNNTSRGIITTYSTVSYQTEVWVPEDITVDFAGSYDDTVGIFFQKINEDGTRGAWTTVMDFGSNCVAVSKNGYTIAAGHYLMDFRAVDQSGNAYAIANFSTAGGKRLGLGIRYNDSTGATSSAKNNYYALDIDTNGYIAFGDGALRISNPYKVFTANNVDIANGVTFTIDNPDTLAQSMAVSGDFTGTGTLRVTNSAGNTLPLALSGSTAGNLSLGENMTVQLSKDNVFDVAGMFTSDSALRFEINLDGITEDTTWFAGADATMRFSCSPLRKPSPRWSWPSSASPISRKRIGSPGSTFPVRPGC
ncbi:MAG: autotransporter-associated beta strand repeat-containing protein [Planctomycetia bacterium]|nr:autotransporter-associated beta strand repeat-containing protein [Planctomycetia bacterium]